MHIYSLLLATVALQMSEKKEIYSAPPHTHTPKCSPWKLSKEYPATGVGLVASVWWHQEKGSALTGPQLMELFSSPCKGPCGATTYSVRGPEFQGALPSSPVNMLSQDTQLLRRDCFHSQDGSRSWRGSNNQLKLMSRTCPELQVSLLINCSCLVGYSFHYKKSQWLDF